MNRAPAPVSAEPAVELAA